MASYEKKWGLLLSEMITITDEMTTIRVANFMNFRWGGERTPSSLCARDRST